MSDSGRTNRPSSPTSSSGPTAAEPTKVFRSLKPGEIGPARMNPVNEERAAAAGQIQRTMKAWRASSGGGAGGQAGVPKGSGAPLSSSIRSRMEPKLGASLGSVRVHTGSESADAAKGFGARAFTVGEDVHFNAGQFQPGTKEGDKLLAHELTHVVQGQKSGIQRKPEGDDKGGGEKGAEGGGGGGGEGGAEAKGGGAEVSDPSEPAEKEADATGDKVGEELHGDDKKDGEKGEKGGGGGKDKKDKDKKDHKKGGGKEGEKGEGKDGEKGEGKDGEKGEGKDGEKGGKDGEKGGEAGADGGKAEEKPAPIAAKLEGIGLKVFRAPPAPAPNAAPAGPKKPQNDADYQALPGYAEFTANTGKIGVTPAESLGFWKGCMDQLFANQDEVKKLAGNKAGILAYVDAAGQRGGFTTMADAMLTKFPLDMTKEYGLWSGKNSEVYAQAQGCQVLEGTQLGSLFNGVKTAFNNNWDCMQGLWRAISDAYAKKIATIMLGKPIRVFVRKQGDIFAQVESGAVAEVQQKVNAKPTFQFHAIACDGTFSNENNNDGTPNNADTRKELIALADEPKATTASKSKQLRIFDWGANGVVPAGELKEVGAVSGDAAQVAAAVALLAPSNAATQTKADAVKKQLQAAKKP